MHFFFLLQCYINQSIWVSCVYIKKKTEFGKSLILSRISLYNVSFVQHQFISIITVSFLYYLCWGFVKLTQIWILISFFLLKAILVGRDVIFTRFCNKKTMFCCFSYIGLQRSIVNTHCLLFNNLYVQFIKPALLIKTSLKEVGGNLYSLAP